MIWLDQRCLSRFVAEGLITHASSSASARHIYIQEKKSAGAWRPSTEAKFSATMGLWIHPLGTIKTCGTTHVTRICQMQQFLCLISHFSGFYLPRNVRDNKPNGWSFSVHWKKSCSGAAGRKMKKELVQDWIQWMAVDIQSLRNCRNPVPRFFWNKNQATLLIEVKRSIRISVVIFFVMHTFHAVGLWICTRQMLHMQWRGKTNGCRL